MNKKDDERLVKSAAHETITKAIIDADALFDTAMEIYIEKNGNYVDDVVRFSGDEDRLLFLIDLFFTLTSTFQVWRGTDVMGMFHGTEYSQILYSIQIQEGYRSKKLPIKLNHWVVPKEFSKIFVYLIANSDSQKIRTAFKECEKNLLGLHVEEDDLF